MHKDSEESEVILRDFDDNDEMIAGLDALIESTETHQIKHCKCGQDFDNPYLYTKHMALEHNFCTICHLWFQKNMFEEIVKHFSDLHNISLGNGETYYRLGCPQW